METVVLVIALLACPLGMLLMGLFMWKGTSSKREPRAPRTLDDLRAEHRELGGEIERLEQAENGTGLKSVER
jgi:cytochrome c-type biogenesis protein CcmH/NrfF